MSWIESVFHLPCPRCRQGEMFVKPLKLTEPLRMHKRCSVCGQRMEPEVGFSYGAMFISYVFIGILSLSIVGLLVFGLHWSTEVAFTVLIAFLALIFIWNLRFTRSLWFHLVVKFDRRFAGKVK